jgi:rhodanese-related sulfurtransferase
MVQQIAPSQAAALLASREDALLLDVREHWEVALASVTGATVVPMSELAAKFEDLPKQGAVIVLCHHGVRSNMVAHALARAGNEEVYNIRGGIDAWSHEVDATIARY